MSIVLNRQHESAGIIRTPADVSALQGRMGFVERWKTEAASSILAGHVKREVEQATIEGIKQLALGEIALRVAHFRTTLAAEAVPRFAAAMKDLNIAMDTHDRGLTATTIQGILSHIENREDALAALNILEGDGKISGDEKFGILHQINAMVSADIEASERRMQNAKRAGMTLADQAINGIERAASSIKL